MRRNLLVSLFLSLAGLAISLAAAGCSGSSSVAGPDAAVAPAAGNAVVQGTVTGAGAGLQVGVVGTPLVAPVDEEGQFALAGVPAGTATLKFEGGGIDARVSVPGLQDGLVTSITVQLSGGSAQLTGAPNCAPTADTFFSGILEQMAGTRLVVAGRTVDASQIQKVWRGERRIQLSDLHVGEKVKVWGTLRGDGVVAAEEIAALTSGPGSDGETWVSFTGVVESVGASALDLHGNPNTGSHPTLLVKGITVRTDGGTKVKRSDGSAMSASEIKVGQGVAVEGWKKADGSVRATLIVVEGTGTGTGATWVTFKGRVEGVTAADAAAGVHVSCVLRMKVAGRYVETDGSTVFKWSDGSALDPYSIVAGDKAYVEGWSKPEGYVLATKVVVDKR
jgi:Domain of unknown function (DUF5666)